MINTELIDILKEYRSGNKDIINSLYSDGITKDGLNYGESNLKINDKGLEYCIKSWYEIYKTPYKTDKNYRCTKFNEQVYNGSIEDMKLDVLKELFALFEDTTFCPETNAEIYGKLKYNSVKAIGENIGTSVLGKYNNTSLLAISDIKYFIIDNEYSLFENKSLCNELNFKYDTNDGYCQVITEVKEMFPNLKNILKKGATAQNEVIDLICKYYDYIYYDDNVESYILPPQNVMLEYYKKEYGKEMSQPRYSKILSSIFDVMADCTVSLKGKSVERQKFINGDYDKMKIINYNKKSENKLVSIANELINHVPVNVRKDKYYNFISRAFIMDMCCRCSDVIYNIKHKSELYLDDYAELLHAIGYIIKDHCKDKFESYCEQVKLKYQNYSFITEYPIIDIALGQQSKQLNWYLKGGKGNVQLVRYKYNKNGELIACRDTKNDMYKTVDVTDATIIQIGRLKMIVSDNSMKIYCFSVDDEFLSIKKNEYNKFDFCKKIA